MSSSHSHKAVSANSSRDDKAGTVSVEQFRKEMSELRTEISISREENVLLNEVISTIGSTLKLDEVLSHLVNIIVRATSCHAAFIYLYNKDKDRLVLASTSEQHEHLVGKIALGL
ncbi:MAG TPA: hypothetical protein DCK85_01275, partial [Ktedonobacter sp.]|nr:hypothetical protein [Ktedonobacter sp.]